MLGPVASVPLWTYFDLAETHQWLFLDRLDRTWATLNWFWDHQSSPGLYTWWEGKGEENSFGRWTRVRWNGRSMTAVIRGERHVKVKLGTSFPKTADLEVTYQET